MANPVSWASSDSTRRAMIGSRRRDTKPEIAVRRLLHAAGLRYRVDYPLPTHPRRRADIAFTRRKVVIFIDGCFWHSCSEHGRSPATHAEYWRPKLERNADRDRETSRAWSELDWTVLRFWEHNDPQVVAAQIGALIRAAQVHTTASAD